jgi:hypothetical protein
MAQLELVPFVPTSASYQIWHPPNLIVGESKDGIVTITSPVTNSNLTITSYRANQNITEKILTDFFQDATEGYIPLSEIKSSIISSRIWLEGEFKDDNTIWIWWALAYSNQIVLASINSEEVLNENDRHLYTFMIDKMEIYPGEFNDEKNTNKYWFEEY